MVDDMETYRAIESLEIWSTWVDGFFDPANGAVVGNGPTFAPETGIVHSGRQSLPIHFDNGTAAISETTRPFDPPRDWTQSDIQILTLYFLKPINNAGTSRFYVKINDTKVVYEDASEPAGPEQWTQWNIDLISLTADLTKVRTLTIGIEGAETRGVIYLDDIQLHRHAR